jgi:hypothetical protein
MSLIWSTGIRAALAAAVWTALTGISAAQFPPPPPPSGSGSSVQDRWPEPPRNSQGNSQGNSLGNPRSNPQPTSPTAAATPPRRQASPAGTEDDTAPPKAAPPRPAANVVACGGVFAKDSTHLKLAQKYDSRNVVFADVDGPDGSKIKASVLFPNDPRRRLEVLWNDEASRSDMSVIAINGKSQWIAPKGLKLGLSLAAIEKLNGKPFKVGAFGTDGSASVLDWEGGALGSLAGGCKVGLRLAADGKAPPDVRSAVTGDKQFLSNDASLRAVKPSVAEILLGY